MKRGIFIAAIFLLAGAVVNVAWRGGVLLLRETFRAAVLSRAEYSRGGVLDKSRTRQLREASDP